MKKARRIQRRALFHRALLFIVDCNFDCEKSKQSCNERSSSWIVTLNYGDCIYCCEDGKQTKQDIHVCLRHITEMVMINFYNYNIYDLNGNHLGWFENGIVRDHEGYAVGFKEGAASIYTKYEPYKSYKQYKPYKAYKQYAPYKTYYKTQFSNEPLSLFLMLGKG